MKCAVLLVVALAALGGHAVPADVPDKHGVAVDAAACADVHGYFAARNLSTAVPESPVDGAALQVCGASRSCCTVAMEDALRSQVHRDFAALVHHNSKATQDVLATASASLRDHLVRLARWSEGKTLTLFAQVYKRMALLANEPIHSLYADIVRYLDTPAPQQAAQGAAEAAWLSSPPQGLSMTDSVNRFFAKLFPLTFHTAAQPMKRGGAPQRQLEATYEQCLSSRMAEVQPFGEAPRALAHSLSRALEAARVLLGVLSIGADVLNATDSMLIDDPASGSACPAVLLRLWACPRCAGLGEAVRPCQGYCLNVLRGCVTERTSDLDEPWASFVEAAAKLAGSAAAAPPFPGRPRDTARAAPYQLNAEEAIRQMENKISEAIMFAMEHGPAVERKMKSACGPPKWVEVAADAVPSTTPWPWWGRNPYPLADDVLGVGGEGPLGSPASPASAVHFAKTLRELQESLLRSRSFYADLADVLCADEGFASKNSQPCWNGQRVGEYTKTVVAASVSAQRYNPELPWGSHGATEAIPHLGDQLRHLRQLVLSQLAELATVPESDSFVRDEEGYEAEAEGSAAGGASGAVGRGHYAPGTWSDDEDHDSWNVPSEGSGMEGSGDEGPSVDANNVDSNSNWTTDGGHAGSKQSSSPGRGAEAGKDKASGAGHLQLSACTVVLWMFSTRVLRLAAL
ncbi:division abnormally delayed protein [Thrips palmi]|uniref:Division abnormally delayed protein n=1 Tax=Thrips palmi TaxID=161013 RepID=A0A6P8YDV2_THRPL|nr:division abnormally delayed protein [Thrips palmi]